MTSRSRKFLFKNVSDFLHSWGPNYGSLSEHTAWRLDPGHPRDQKEKSPVHQVQLLCFLPAQAQNPIHQPDPGKNKANKSAIFEALLRPWPVIKDGPNPDQASHRPRQERPQWRGANQRAIVRFSDRLDPVNRLRNWADIQHVNGSVCDRQEQQKWSQFFHIESWQRERCLDAEDICFASVEWQPKNFQWLRKLG